MEYIKYVSDEDHLKHIPDYLPVYLLSGGFDNLTKNGKDTIKLYQILKGNGLKDLQYKIYDNKRQDILHDNNYRDIRRNRSETDFMIYELWFMNYKGIRPFAK